jgi:PAS domain S-box-containing protein
MILDNSSETLQKHLAAIVESSDDAIISKDLSGTIRSWNAGAQRIFGYTAEEAVGKHISLLAPPDRLGEIAEILARISRGEHVDHHLTRRMTKDGRLLWISLTVSPIRGADGTVIGASKIARDVTFQRRYVELQEHLAAIVESSDDAIISQDLNGIILTWNRGAEQIFGYTREESVGRHISMIATPDRVDEIPRILERISRGESVEHYETARKTKDGRILSVSLTVSPIRDATGTIIGASKIGRDITQQVKNEQALREANRLLTRSIGDLEQFAYSASHDLQEPLRTVSLYAEMLRRRLGDKLDDRASQDIENILAAALRMQQLLRDLLAFTRASTVDEEPAPEIESAQALDRAIANLEPAIAGCGATVTHGCLPRVCIRPFQLEQLFQNLVGNAIRYRSGQPPEINVSAERSGNMWTFSVRDNGIGIDPRYKEQIFGMFKRLHTSDEYPGTGMGLTICHRIVERAGGRIWVESESGKGSTFRFTLPAGTGAGSAGG